MSSNLRPIPPTRAHELRCHPIPFEGLWRGAKTFEIRREDDRTFAIGDVVVMREWIAAHARYTGRAVLVRVTWITRGAYDVPGNVAILAFDPCLRRKAEGYAPREFGRVKQVGPPFGLALESLPFIEPRKDPTS